MDQKHVECPHKKLVDSLIKEALNQYRAEALKTNDLMGVKWLARIEALITGDVDDPVELKKLVLSVREATVEVLIPDLNR